MLSAADNEKLSSVGPGTPMGMALRQFWTPAVRSSKLIADGAPERVRLLGQDFVAFRGSDGRVGFLDERCPHRGVSLALARNRDCKLECIYHGWKMGADGKVLDVPTEAVERRVAFAARVRTNHYPVREGGGIVWVWLGEGKPAAFPHLNWLDLPPEQVKTRLGIVHCSWLNGLEGQLDSAHIGILHQNMLKPDIGANIGQAAHDSAPRFEFEVMPYGFREAALRNLPNGEQYARIREFVLPYYSYIPRGARNERQQLTIAVPVDDEHSAQWDVYYNLELPLSQADLGVDFEVNPDDCAVGMGTLETRFGQDRAAMQRGSFTGFGSIRKEDFAVNVGQGAIADRTAENLSSSDIPIVRARRLLLEAARRATEKQPVIDAPESVDWTAIRAVDQIMAAGTDWRALSR